MSAVVIGLPLNMDGSEGPARKPHGPLSAPSPRWHPAHRLLGRTASTAAVTRELIAQERTRQRADVIDRMAAAYIFQGALDRLAVLARSDESGEADA